MKKIGFLFISYFILQYGISNAQAVPAKDIVATVLEKAATQNKSAIIIFHASWCIWCKRLDASLNDKKVKKLFARYYIIDHLVIEESKGKEQLENAGGEDFLKKWGGLDQGLPFWVVMDSHGEVKATSMYKAPGKSKAENIGCPAAPDEVSYFLEILKNTSTLTSKQLAKIEKRFHKNQVNH